MKRLYWKDNVNKYKEMAAYFWRVKTLKRVGNKYGVTRERVRQIMERLGLNARDIKKAIKDFNTFNRIEKTYTMCRECGSDFRISNKRKDGGELCRLCSNKHRARNNHYSAQLKYYHQHLEKSRKRNRDYYWSHKEELNKKERRFRKENRFHVSEREKQSYIRRLLNPKDLI